MAKPLPTIACKHPPKLSIEQTLEIDRAKAIEFMEKASSDIGAVISGQAHIHTKLPVQAAFGSTVDELTTNKSFIDRGINKLKTASIKHTTSDLPFADGMAIPVANRIIVDGGYLGMGQVDRAATLAHEAIHLAGSFGHGGTFSTGPDPYNINSYIPMRNKCEE